MGLLSNTGLLASVSVKTNCTREQSQVQLQCDVTPAPFMLRPYAGLYNPFSHSCSVLCNHPAESAAKEYVKRAKDAWGPDGKPHHFHEDLTKYQDGAEKEKNRTPHDLFTEDMFRRYAETDSRPLTPAPTLASGKSRGSRRCLTPDQPRHKTTIVVDLRRSHSQETLYYHGYTTLDTTFGPAIEASQDLSLPSLNLTESHPRLLKGQTEQLPPLASPLVLTKRNLPAKEAAALRTCRKNQLKALNLGKTGKNKNKAETPGTTQRSTKDKDTSDAPNTAATFTEDGGEIRRRGKRRRKGRVNGSDRTTSAGLAATAQPDPETQVAGISTESHNASSRGSIALVPDDENILPPLAKSGNTKKIDSFLDDDILKFLHREVDEEAIETELNTKRRYVLEEALRTRPDRPYGEEMQALLRELKVPAMSLGDFLHIPRTFSRQSAQFSLPIDSNALEPLTPMQYAARFVNMKKSKQLLYLTVLRKFRPEGYRMPIQDIKKGLVLMMGGILSSEQVEHFNTIMQWDVYEEEDSNPDDIKLTLIDSGYKEHGKQPGDQGELAVDTLKYRTWCGLCAICERMYGRYPPRDKDPPDGMELSDFTMLETKLPVLKIHLGLAEVLNAIRSR